MSDFTGFGGGFAESALKSRALGIERDRLRALQEQAKEASNEARRKRHETSAASFMSQLEKLEANIKLDPRLASQPLTIDLLDDIATGGRQSFSQAGLDVGPFESALSRVRVATPLRSQEEVKLDARQRALEEASKIADPSQRADEITRINRTFNVEAPSEFERNVESLRAQGIITQDQANKLAEAKIQLGLEGDAAATPNKIFGAILQRLNSGVEFESLTPGERLVFNVMATMSPFQRFSAGLPLTIQKVFIQDLETLSPTERQEVELRLEQARRAIEAGRQTADSAGNMLEQRYGISRSLLSVPTGPQPSQARPQKPSESPGFLGDVGGS